MSYRRSCLFSRPRLQPKTKIDFIVRRFIKRLEIFLLRRDSGDVFITSFTVPKLI